MQDGTITTIRESLARIVAKRYPVSDRFDFRLLDNAPEMKITDVETLRSTVVKITELAAVRQALSELFGGSDLTDITCPCEECGEVGILELIPMHGISKELCQKCATTAYHTGEAV